jgi:outer membrane protein OmpA-like peptidoglycan-associated protein
MTGGAGGYDLYWVERFINQNGTSTWGKPNPLTAINTPKNDAYPFISYQGTLFFSSDGRHINSDRTDFNLYFVVDPFTNTTEVVDLNEPFNTTADDKNFVLDPDGKKGFFVSNRKPGYGKEDIFRFDAPRGLEGTGKKEVNPVKMVIRDAKSGDLIQNAAIRILQPTEDGFLGGNGNDDFYKIEIAPVQDQKNAVTFSLVRKDATDLGRPELFSNAAGEARTEFDRYRTYLVLVSLDGYRTIEKLHTVEDEKDLVFNFALKEAPLCFRTGGIVLSTEFGTRITNATVKLIHSESGEQISVRTTTNGEFDACLPTEGNYLGTVEREGFQSQSFRTTATRGSRTSSEILLRPLVQGASVEETMPLANGLQDGSIIIMERLFYEYNKATLNQYVVRNLEALYELMIQYPQMEVDILVHTDTRGDYQLNKELTDERAINVKKYLEYRGVESSRINAIGLGESKPRNKCLEGVECSDKEHQENNRLEIMVKKLGSARK